MSKSLTLGAVSFFCRSFKAASIGVGDCLNVPRGPEAWPKNARTSPLVTIPRIPVPVILLTSWILCSARRRYTEGKMGPECDIGSDGDAEGSGDDLGGAGGLEVDSEGKGSCWEDCSS